MIAPLPGSTTRTGRLAGATRLLLAGVVCIVLAASTTAGTPVFVGDADAKLVAMTEINHATWQELVAKYVDADGRVDYQAWHASQTDRQLLDSYLDQLSTAQVSATPLDKKSASEFAHRLAFWINAYNALTIQGILREYPTTSIRNHTPKLWGYHIWHDLKLYVGHQPFSLDEIEHQVLRKMGEPRIHFAIVCASIGCPRLLNEAYVAERIESQLDLSAKDFFSRSQNFRHDVAGKKFYLSSIMNWFAEDFGANRSEQLQGIAPWLPDEAAQNAAKAGTIAVSYLTYNWDLNSQ